MLYMIAAGTKIDTQRSERFGKQIEQIYRDPFVQVKETPKTRDEIVSYIYKRVEEAMQWI